jgi:UDP-N-acetyl-2-amino-2-deoxyglucuronate dehydrogenase
MATSPTAPDVVPADRKVRFALVGCGRIAANHVEAIKQHAAHAEIVAVCDVDPAALAKARQDTGAPGFATIDELLAKSDADAVILATPSGIHAAQGIMAARAGRHVVTEKPMATRWEHAKELVRVCDETRRRLFVVKQNRLNPTLQLLKRAVDQHRFGRIYLVQVNVFWARPQSYYDSAPWRGTWEFDGGAFMNQASHYVDLLPWLVGPIASVQATTATLARRIEVEDTGVATFRYRSGALGSMSVTMLTFPKNLEGSITILGEQGTAKIGGVAVNQVEQWQFAQPHPDDETLKAASYETTSVYGRGHIAYYDNVIQTLRGKAQPNTDGREGLHSLELLTAIYLSARDGRAVGLPLDY